MHPALITAIHDIDIMLWFAGQEVRWVRAVDRLADRDDSAHGLWGMLEFENGAVGMIETSWLIPDGAEISTNDAFQVTGLRGSAKVQLESPPLRVWGMAGSAAPDVVYEPVVHGVTTGALGMELAHFAQCALARVPSPVVTPQDGIRALAVVLALIDAAETVDAVFPDSLID